MDRLPSHTVRWPPMGTVIDRVVPVDDRLERQARQWTRSEDWLLRKEGAKALGYFRSDENVAILKRLLDDPSYSTEVKEEGGQVIEIARDYFVRAAAYASLQKVGIHVAKPVLRVPLPQKTGEKEKPKSPKGA
jgi:HEAT repeat protein